MSWWEVRVIRVRVIGVLQYIYARAAITSPEVLKEEEVEAVLTVLPAAVRVLKFEEHDHRGEASIFGDLY